MHGILLYRLEKNITEFLRINLEIQLDPVTVLRL